MGLGRRSRASHDVTATADSIRPPGLSDDLWQRFLQVCILGIRLCQVQMCGGKAFNARTEDDVLAVEFFC